MNFHFGPSREPYQSRQPHKPRVIPDPRPLTSAAFGPRTRTKRRTVAATHLRVPRYVSCEMARRGKAAPRQKTYLASTAVGSVCDYGQRW